MRRKFLIVDDHDDLRSALTNVFEKLGHSVVATNSREDAVKLDSIEEFDLVITDLDGSAFEGEDQGARCLPKFSGSANRDDVKAFKICAIHFHRDRFNETELQQLFETVLNYKSRFVDRGPRLSERHEMIEFEFPSTIKVAHAILEYLMKRVEKAGMSDARNSNLFLALDEALVNAVEHGNRFDSRKLVRVQADISSTEARFTIEDEGEGFDVAAIPDPTDPANLFKASGRGVLIIHNIMDEVTYNEKGNRLTMVKRPPIGDRQEDG